MSVAFETSELESRAKATATYDRYLLGDPEPISVLVIVPTLGVGGAEMDLARTLPRLDNRFKVSVFTFLARGPLAQQLEAAGIEIIGPFLPRQARWCSIFRQRFLRAVSKLKLGLRLILLALTPKFLRGTAQHRWRACRRLLAGLQSGFVSCAKAFVSSLPASIRRSFRIGSTWSIYIMIGLGLAPFIRARRFDVIHTVLPNSYVVGSVANLPLNRRPLIMSRLSLNWYQGINPLFHLVERLLLHGNVSAAVCNCSAIFRQLREEGVAASKLHLIRNGIDVAEFSNRMVNRQAARKLLGISSEAVVFSVVANFHAYKGHDDILCAFAHICPEMPEATMLFVGRDVDGNRARLEAKCRALGVADKVRFLGERTDIPLIMSAADIHISGSHTEGLPNNIIEAMCAGLPVVATAVGGTVELLVDRQTGLLVPPSDSTALGRAMLSLARDPELSARLGAAGHNRVASHFSIDHTVADLEKLYAQIASRYRSFQRPTRSQLRQRIAAAVAAFPRLSALLRGTAMLVRKAWSEVVDTTAPVALAIRQFGANVSSLVSDGLMARAAPGPWIRNFLIGRRQRLRKKFLFDYMFYDPATVQRRSYRVHPGRILMIVPSLARGGAERMMIATAAGLVQRGYQVRILALAQAPDQPDFAEEIRRHGLDYRVWQGNAMPFWAWWRRFNSEVLRPYAPDLEQWHYNWAAEIAIQIEDYRPVIVHAWLNFSTLLAGPVAHLMGVPRFVGGQHDILDGAKRAWAEPHVEAYRAIADLPNATLINVCAVGARIYERWLDRPEHSVKIVPNMFWPDSVRRPSLQEALGYRRELGIPADAQVVTTVTRMIEAKDPLLSVETAAQIMQRRSGVWFVFAGYGELADTVSKRVFELGLNHRVILPGAVSDVGLIYAISDVFLFTSQAEAAPIVLLEAQSTGLASVTSNVGGISEMVLDGITAKIIANRSAAEFAEAVLTILDDNEWRSRARVVGPTFVAERFGPDHVLDATLALYGLSNPS